MVEKANRSRVGEEPRGDPAREWEVFVREEQSEPLRHVGSVTAVDVGTARDQAARLFAWYADDLWLCPADAVHRFSTHALGDEASSADSEADVPGDGEGGAEDAAAVECVPEDEPAGPREDDTEPRVSEL